MTVSLTDYNQLPRGIQGALLLQDGTPLVWRRKPGGNQAVLYSLGSFYVEASLDGAFVLQHLYAFRDIKNLTPYLARIDWQEFV